MKNYPTATYASSALKIIPLVVRVYTVCFLKCFDIAVFFYFESVGSIMNQSKYNNIFTGLKCILQSFKLSLLAGLSELWLSTQSSQLMIYDYTCRIRYMYRNERWCSKALYLNTTKRVSGYNGTVFVVVFLYKYNGDTVINLLQLVCSKCPK